MLFFRCWEFAALAVCVTGLSTMAFGEGAPAESSLGLTGRPALLNDAFNAFLEHQGRWAYTETRTSVGIDGNSRGESRYRVDPSAPYAEQNKPLVIRGMTPTAKQLKDAAARGERAGRRHLAEQENLPAPPVGEEKPKVHRADEVHLRVGGQKITPQIDQAKVVKEDDVSVIYEVPMHPEGKGDANAILDKFELTARVNKASHQFEQVTIRQRASLRVKLIAKISDSFLTIEFSTPDPHYPSVPTKFTVDGHLSLLFGKDHAMHNESERTDLRHVTPYDERFGVKLGPMRTMEL